AVRGGGHRRPPGQGVLPVPVRDPETRGRHRPAGGLRRGRPTAGPRRRRGRSRHPGGHGRPPGAVAAGSGAGRAAVLDSVRDRRDPGRCGAGEAALTPARVLTAPGSVGRVPARSSRIALAMTTSTDASWTSIPIDIVTPPAKTPARSS